MYYPIGWPRAIDLSITSEKLIANHICCDAVRILVAVVSNDALCIWYANPLTPIAFHRRTKASISTYGSNKTIVWRPDSRQIAILTTSGAIILYKINFKPNGNGILMQVDSPIDKLRRESAELFIRENIPCLSLHETSTYRSKTNITVISCISLTELLIATDQCELIRLLWTDLEPENDTSNIETSPSVTLINLRNILFYINHNCHVKTLPAIDNSTFIVAMEYSPFIGGCAAVFNDNRAALLVANHLRFDSQNLHGFWATNVDDATICSVNHKFRLLAYGRRNSDIIVFSVEDATGGLEFSHHLSLNSNVDTKNLGPVNELKWSPDGCVLVVTWDNGGIALWSTFGALLMSSFNWDFGLHVDLFKYNPLRINRIEWSTEGYQLFLTCKVDKKFNDSNILQLNFVKSVLAANPCMTSQSHILLQGDDSLYLSQGHNLEKVYFSSKRSFPNNRLYTLNTRNTVNTEYPNMEIKKSADTLNILSESKYWNVLQLPLAYASSNWPIRYSAIDTDGLHVAVAGRTGLAHYSMLTKKWKVFGNETQEKDFVVSGGLLYWEDYLLLGCYSLLDRTDEIRCYPENKKLDNQFGSKILVRAPMISLNIFQNKLITLNADGIISLFTLTKLKNLTLNMECAYELDVKNICVHPACIVSLTITSLRNDFTPETYCSNNSNEYESTFETIIVNVSGRILMIQRDPRNNVISLLMASCIASCVECFWISKDIKTSPMHDSLWLYSGASGMRVWLPILPPTDDQIKNAHHLHTFMSKRIMLSFPLKLHPLIIFFDNVIALGVENETSLYSNELVSHFALPFCILEHKSQVYLHKILRQLIKRNLGYSAWEIAKSCRLLPYFPHSLELLLHEVLEEEATSKEPIPDALLPSILNFIREFPVYLQTVIQCARKTEIALWPYLFSVAGKPKYLFQQCINSEDLDTAASFLVILQNLEPSLISKEYATLLLDTAIKNYKWELAKDLIRFLKAIDPNEIDSPRSSMIVNLKISPPSQTKSHVNSNVEAFNMVLRPITLERTFPTAVILHTPKERKEKPSVITATTSNVTTPANASEDLIVPITSASGISSLMRRKGNPNSPVKNRKEVFCIDTILQNHARTFLQNYKLIDLGYMSAFLDFHLVSWLTQEAERAAKLDDFVTALKRIHEEFNLTLALNFSAQSEQVNTPDNLKHNEMDKKSTFDNFSHSQRVQSESGYFSLPAVDTLTYGTIKHSDAASIQEVSIYDYPLVTDLPYDNAPCSYDNDNNVFAFGLDSFNIQMGCNTQLLPEKLAIKIRYLLQLFIEANCIDYALVLSILLKDAASIGRIINGVIRSESLTVCNRIYNALKRLMQWSLHRECIYYSFMISLRPYICLLEQYIVSAQNNAEGSYVTHRKSKVSEIDKDDHDNQSKMLVTSLNQSAMTANWNLERMLCEEQENLLQPQILKNDNTPISASTKQKGREVTITCSIM